MLEERDRRNQRRERMKTVGGVLGRGAGFVLSSNDYCRDG